MLPNHCQLTAVDHSWENARDVWVGNGNTLQFELDGYIIRYNLGTTRVMLETRPSGAGRQVNAAAYSDYLPFGEPMRAQGSGAGRFGFTGQEYDAETDLHNYKARLYSAETGQFQSPDPAGQFHSPYVGMGNNPVNYVDPDGEWVVEALYFAYKAYQVYQTVKTAYNVYQAFNKGGYEGGMNALFQVGTSYFISMSLGGVDVGMPAGNTMIGNMIEGGIRSSAASAITSARFNNGNFSGGLSWQSFGNGVINVAGGYAENAYNEHRYWKGSGHSAGLPNYHEISDQEKLDYTFDYMRRLKDENRESGDVREIFSFYNKLARRNTGPTASQGLVRVNGLLPLPDESVPISMYFNVVNRYVEHNHYSIFDTRFGYRENLNLFTLDSAYNVDFQVLQFKLYTANHAYLFANEFYFRQPIIRRP